MPSTQACVQQHQLLHTDRSNMHCCVLQGSAGQSFGCFIVAGMETKLVGEANDYVGKGMAGGQISIMPPPESTFNPGESSLVGNTCLYGATGGRLFVNGRAGTLLSSLETAYICPSILLIMQINCKPCCRVVFGSCCACSFQSSCTSTAKVTVNLFLQAAAGVAL